MDCTYGRGGEQTCGPRALTIEKRWKKLYAGCPGLGDALGDAHGGTKLCLLLRSLHSAGKSSLKEAVLLKAVPMGSRWLRGRWVCI